MALVGFALFAAMFVITVSVGAAVPAPGLAGWLLMAVATAQAAREKGRSLLVAVVLALLVPLGWVIVARLGIRQEVDAEARTLLGRRAARFLRYCLIVWLMLGSVVTWLILALTWRDESTQALSAIHLGLLACSSLATIAFAAALLKTKRWGLYGLALMVVLGAVGNTLAGQPVSEQLPAMVGSLSVLVLAWPGWADLG